MASVGGIVRSLMELVDLVEKNSIQETLAEYSDIVDTDINEAVTTNLFAIIDRLAPLVPDHGGRGRPAVSVPFGVIEGYMLQGFKIKEIAELFGVSHRTIRRRMHDSGLRVSDMYSQMSDTELDEVIAELHLTHPNTGYRMMGSFLRVRGLRVQIARVRDSLRRVDAAGTESQAMANRTLRQQEGVGLLV